MPNPLAKLKSNATFFLGPTTGHGQSQSLSLAAMIIGLSAQVDHELNLMGANVLGADADAALAMLETIDGRRKKLELLEAAAKASFDEASEQLFVFQAIVKAATSAQSDRHKLAHWVWGHSPDLPDAILLAEPKVVRAKRIGLKKFLDRPPHDMAQMLKDPSFDFDNRMKDFDELRAPDTSKILVYRPIDLQRNVMVLLETLQSFTYFERYLRPIEPNALSNQDQFDLKTSAEALERLKKQRLFREAFLHVSNPKGQNNNR